MGVIDIFYYREVQLVNVFESVPIRFSDYDTTE